VRRSLLVASALLVLFGIYWTVIAFELPYFQRITPGPGFFPRWVGGLFTVIAALLFVAMLRSREDEPSSWPDRAGWRNVGLTVGVLALCILLFDALGYVITTTLLMLVTMAAIGRHRLPLLVAVAAGTSLGTYLLFRSVLQVPLPRGVLGF
jgi:putative tricarboxylic transport membrane protein